MGLAACGSEEPEWLLPVPQTKPAPVVAYEATKRAEATPPRVIRPERLNFQTPTAGVTPEQSTPGPSLEPVPEEARDTLTEWLLSWGMAMMAENLTGTDEGLHLREFMAAWREFEECGRSAAEAEVARGHHRAAGSYEDAAEAWLAPAVEEVHREVRTCALTPDWDAPRWDEVNEEQRNRGWNRLIAHAHNALGATGPVALQRDSAWELPEEIADAAGRMEHCQQQDWDPPKAAWSLGKTGLAYREITTELAQCYGHSERSLEE